MIVGYANGFGPEKTKQPQQLREAGCSRVFADVCGVRGTGRVERAACLRSLRRGDVLIVTHLRVLSTSLDELVWILSRLVDGGIYFVSLARAIDARDFDFDDLQRLLGALNTVGRYENVQRRLGATGADGNGRPKGRAAVRTALSRDDVRTAAKLLVDPRVRTLDVAKKFGVSPRTILLSLNREGLIEACRRRPGARPALSPDDVKAAAALLADPMLTKQGVAQRFGVARLSLDESLKRAGLHSEDRRPLVSLRGMSDEDARKASQMLSSTMTKTEVAAQFGVARVTLNKALKRAGVSGSERRAPGPRAKMSPMDVIKAIGMLSSPGWTKAAVARHFGVSRPTLNAAIERESRRVGEAATWGGEH